MGFGLCRYGDALIANFGIGLIVFLASLLAIIPLILGTIAIGSGFVLLGGMAIAVGAVALLLISLISSALNSISTGALYLYASEGTVPQQFDDDLFRHAFAQK